MNALFCKRLKSLRKETGETQEHVSAEIGIAINSLRRYEAGDRLPCISVVCLIAKHYNVTTDYLLGMTDDRKEPIDKLRAERDGLLKEIERLTNIADEAKRILSKAHSPGRKI